MWTSGSPSGTKYTITIIISCAFYSFKNTNTYTIAKIIRIYIHIHF